MSFWTDLRLPCEQDLIVGFYDLTGYMRFAEASEPRPLLDLMAGFFTLTGSIVQQAGGDAILSAAFQNLQFTVGNVGVGPVTKFWTGLVEWWHTGEPSFSANCQQLPRDAPKQVVIRLSATGPGGWT